MITAEQLREIVDYDPLTGLLHWRDTFAAGQCCGLRKPCPKPGDAVRFYRNPLGYWSVAFKGQQYLVHRVVWLHVYGRWPKKGMHIDHIDHDGFNNRITNLREATRAQNYQNGRRKAGASGFRGVTWHTASSRWRATIWKDGKRVDVGLFKTQDEAARARDDAAKHAYGQFAMLNF